MWLWALLCFKSSQRCWITNIPFCYSFNLYSHVVTCNILTSLALWAMVAQWTRTLACHRIARLQHLTNTGVYAIHSKKPWWARWEEHKTEDLGWLKRCFIWIPSVSYVTRGVWKRSTFHNVNGTSSNLITKFSFLYFEWGFAYCVDRSGRSILQYSCSCQWNGRRSHCWGMDSLVHNQAHIYPVDRLNTHTHTMGW